MRPHYYNSLFLFFILTRTLFSATSPLHLQQSGGIDPHNFGSKKIKLTGSPEDLRRVVLRRNSQDLNSSKGAAFDRCTNAMEENRLINDFFNLDILKFKNPNGSNLLHCAAEYQRVCLATFLLALELFYIKKDKFSEDYIPLADQRDNWGNKPKDIAEKSLRSKKCKNYFQLNYDSQNSVQKVEEIFLDMIEKIDKRYRFLFLMGENIHENVEDIMKVLK